MPSSPTTDRPEPVARNRVSVTGLVSHPTRSVGAVRLIHTSDWHLGRAFHQVGLLGAQAAYLDHLVDVVRTERVDAVLVSGDVYDRAMPSPETVELLSQTVLRLVDAGAQVVRQQRQPRLRDPARVRVRPARAGRAAPAHLGRRRRRARCCSATPRCTRCPTSSRPWPPTRSAPPSAPTPACCAPRWRGCAPTPSSAAGARWSWPTPSSPAGSTSESERDISVGGVSRRAPRGLRRRRLHGPGPPARPPGGRAGRPLQRLPRGDVVLRVPAHRKGSLLVDLSGAAPGRRARRGAGRAAAGRAARHPRGAARRPRARARRRRPGARSPSPTPSGRSGRWTGSSGASRTRSCCSSRTPACRSAPPAVRRAGPRARPTSRCAATSSSTCAAGAGASEQERAVLAEAVEGRGRAGRSVRTRGRPTRPVPAPAGGRSREAAPARDRRRSGRSPAPRWSTSTSSPPRGSSSSTAPPARARPACSTRSASPSTPPCPARAPRARRCAATTPRPVPCPRWCSSSPPRGRRLRITRSPEFLRPKKRGTGTTGVQAKVVLEERVAGGGCRARTRNDEAARRQGRPRHGHGAVRQGGAAAPGRLRGVPAGHPRGPPRGARAALRHLSASATSSSGWPTAAGRRWPP